MAQTTRFASFGPVFADALFPSPARPKHQRNLYITIISY